MTLWSITKSPLMIGCDLTVSDDPLTMALFTNREAAYEYAYLDRSHSVIIFCPFYLVNSKARRHHDHLCHLNGLMNINH